MGDISAQNLLDEQIKWNRQEAAKAASEAAVTSAQTLMRDMFASNAPGARSVMASGATINNTFNVNGDMSKELVPEFSHEIAKALANSSRGPE
jgi:hypothetical protein